MSFYRGMTCENVTLKGDKGTPITAYVAKPSGPGPFPGVVLVTISRAGASSTLRRRVGSRITVISRSVLTSMSVRERATRTTSPPKCADPSISLNELRVARMPRFLPPGI